MNGRKARERRRAERAVGRRCRTGWPAECLPPGTWRTVLDRLEPLDLHDADGSVSAALHIAVLEIAATRDPAVAEAVEARLHELDEAFDEVREEEWERQEEERFVLGLDDDDEEPQGPPPTLWSLACDFAGTVLYASRRRGPRTAATVVDWVSTSLGRSGPGVDQQAILLGGPGAPRPLDLGPVLSGPSPLTVRLWLAAGCATLADPEGRSRRDTVARCSR